MLSQVTASKELAGKQVALLPFPVLSLCCRCPLSTWPQTDPSVCSLSLHLFSGLSAPGASRCSLCRPPHCLLQPGSLQPSDSQPVACWTRARMPGGKAHICKVEAGVFACTPFLCPLPGGRGHCALTPWEFSCFVPKLSDSSRPFKALHSSQLACFVLPQSLPLGPPSDCFLLIPHCPLSLAVSDAGISLSHSWEPIPRVVAWKGTA